MEQKRRSRLARTKCYVKIYLNSKLVHTTSESPLHASDFSVHWSQIFNIYMLSYPDSIRLQLYDYVETRGNERLIAELDVPVPELNCSSANYSLEDYEFASADAYHMHLKTSNQIELFYTCGKLRAGSGWALDERDGTLLAPQANAGSQSSSTTRQTSSQQQSVINQDEMRNYDAIAALGVSQMQNMDSLAKWVEKSNLDPNDPRNADLINLIRVSYISNLARSHNKGAQKTLFTSL